MKYGTKHLQWSIYIYSHLKEKYKFLFIMSNEHGDTTYCRKRTRICEHRIKEMNPSSYSITVLM